MAPRAAAAPEPVAAGPTPEQCLWCKKNDYTLHYSPRMLLTCDMCLNAWCHIQCDAVRHSRPPLTASVVNSDTPWFCSTDCAEVAAALDEETNAPRRPLPGQPLYTFEIVRADVALPPGRDPGCAAYVASVVDAALKIFGASFAPLLLEDGRDMLELVCRSYFDKDGDDPHDFSSFRVAALRHRNTVVSVATLRVFGRGLAELPFVATRETHRHAGNMRRLVACVESLLRRFGVRQLVLPAIADVEHIWTHHFAMSRMDGPARAALEERVVTPEAGTAVMLAKRLDAAGADGAKEKEAGLGLLVAPKGGAMLAAITHAAAAARPAGAVVGEGSYASLLPPGGAADVAAATAAASTAARATARAAAAAATAREEAVGHAIADVLLSTMSDVDDERRAAQAAAHALELRNAALQRQAAQLAAQLAAATEALRALRAAAAPGAARIAAAAADALLAPAAAADTAAAMTWQATPDDLAAAGAAQHAAHAAAEAAQDAAAAAAAASPEAAPSSATSSGGGRQYRGVYRSGVKWTYDIGLCGERLRRGGFGSAEEAARAADAACVARGATERLNFPLSDYIGGDDDVAERAEAMPVVVVPPAAVAPAAAPPAPPPAPPPAASSEPRYRGVRFRGATWTFEVSAGGAKFSKGGFATAEEAAAAHDAACRAHGRIDRLNFPLPSDDVATHADDDVAMAMEEEEAAAPAQVLPACEEHPPASTAADADTPPQPPELDAEPAPAPLLPPPTEAGADDDVADCMTEAEAMAVSPPPLAAAPAEEAAPTEPEPAAPEPEPPLLPLLSAAADATADAAGATPLLAPPAAAPAAEEAAAAQSPAAMPAAISPRQQKPQLSPAAEAVATSLIMASPVPPAELAAAFPVAPLQPQEQQQQPPSSPPPAAIIPDATDALLLPFCSPPPPPLLAALSALQLAAPSPAHAAAPGAAAAFTLTDAAADVAAAVEAPPAEAPSPADVADAQPAVAAASPAPAAALASPAASGFSSGALRAAADASLLFSSPPSAGHDAAAPRVGATPTAGEAAADAAANAATAAAAAAALSLAWQASHEFAAP